MRTNSEFCSIVLKPFCSNKCIFCRPLTENNRLSSEELKKLDQDANNAIREFRDKKYKRIEVSGADPLEYNNLLSLLSSLRKNGFEFIRISTNGVRLADEKFLKELLKYGIDLFRIPLYGSNARIHDSITRDKGSFNNTLKGIKNIKKISNKTEILLTSLLLKHNANDLTRILDLMHELGCDDLYFSGPYVSNNDYSYYIPQKMQGYFFRKLLRHAMSSKKKIRFREVPYCVIGFDNDFTENTGKPAHLGARFQPPSYQRTGIIDLPSYRVKKKISICKDCVVSYKCEGLFLNDILKYGIGKLRPIDKKRD